MAQDTLTCACEPAAIIARAMSERVLMANIIHMARVLGWLAGKIGVRTRKMVKWSSTIRTPGSACNTPGTATEGTSDAPESYHSCASRRSVSCEMRCDRQRLLAVVCVHRQGGLRSYSRWQRQGRRVAVRAPRVVRNPRWANPERAASRSFVPQSVVCQSGAPRGGNSCDQRPSRYVSNDIVASEWTVRAWA